MRLSALPRPLGALSQRTERHIASLTMKPSMKFCDRRDKALAGQLGQQHARGSFAERALASVPILHMFVRFFRSRRHRRHRCHRLRKTVAECDYISE
jgi:hypothetical protein